MIRAQGVTVELGGRRAVEAVDLAVPTGELLALVGDIALAEGKPKVHAHVVVGLRTGDTRGGHLLQAHVRPTLEVVITESPTYLKREHDAESGLALIRIGY